jgi:putative ABC transport system permease protein
VIAALDRKVLRDVMHLRGQLVAIAIVIACGLGIFVAMRATMHSLLTARSHYYAHQRFGDVFVRLKRAPEHVATALRRTPGVERVQTRVVVDVTLDVPGMTETAVGRLVSFPDRGRPAVNDVVLRSGRMPRAGRANEVLVSEPFAEAHAMVLGTELGAVINGRWERLRVVGTALSPEFVYAVPPGQLFPDNRRFSVIWMRRFALAAAFDMDGAFNDAALSVARDATVSGVIAHVDVILKAHGGLGAIGRRDQQSAFFIENELRQLRSFALLMPGVFLGVAAFLLNIVVGRIVAGQRGQIAAIKAMGYRDREVGMHYAKLVGVVVVAGVTLGLALGNWLGGAMTQMYAPHYRFPDLPFVMGADVALQGMLASVGAAALGTWVAILRTVRLPPAEAMRPAAPPVYGPSVLERLGLTAVLPSALRMVLREVERKPARALMSIAGIALATGLTVMNAFMFDAVRHMLNVHFGLSERADVRLSLFEPRSTAALTEIAHLPGVIHAEPYRVVPVRMRAGARMRSIAITGLPARPTLHAVLDADLREIFPPEEGLVLSRTLAEILRVTTGDTVQVEVLEGRRPVRDLRVARVAETFVGLPAYMALSAVSRLLGEAVSLNGAWLAVDERHLPALYRQVKETPVIAGVATRATMLRNVEILLDENLGTWITISLSFSLVIAFGVLYNAARITQAERAHELASLRVLGFRRREVGAILLGELGLLVLLAIPLGLLVGTGLATLMARSPGFESEQFRLPLVISSVTYATAVATVVVAAAVSGWSAWKRLDRMDIVDVLKVYE